MIDTNFYPRYVDYDAIYNKNPNASNWISDIPETKLTVGTISLRNAKIREEKKEWFVLVTYTEGEDLPEQYRPLPTEVFTSDDGTLFATVKPTRQFRLANICINGGIQRISRLPDSENGDIRYLLGPGTGPGPETVSLTDLIMQQYEGYCNEKTAQTDSTKTQK